MNDSVSTHIPVHNRSPHPVGEAQRIALIHDWLTGMRGGEKCLEVLCRLFPSADIYTLFRRKGSVSPCISSHHITTSFLQRIPCVATHYRALLPLFPLAIEGFDLKEYHLIISTSHCVAKGVVPPAGALHVCYCLTPMRYIWDLYSDYVTPRAYKKIPASVARIISHYLRLWDSTSSARVDRFVASSNFVASRIRTYYRRDAIVIYPPVETSQFTISTSRPKRYYLLVGAAAPYKRSDLALEAFVQLDLPLRIVGSLPSEDLRRLRSWHAPNITYLGWVSHERLRELYAECKALVYPGVEDFGMAMVEAQSAGRPVIAFGRGGALEAVRGIDADQIETTHPRGWASRYTGIFFSEQTATSLIRAVQAFERVHDRFEPHEIRGWAQRFDRSVFEKHFIGYLQTILEKGDTNRQMWHA